jgi:hypothetical protein
MGIKGDQYGTYHNKVESNKQPNLLLYFKTPYIDQKGTHTTDEAQRIGWS